MSKATKSPLIMDINEKFIDETSNFSSHIIFLKSQCDRFDESNPTDNESLIFLKEIDKNNRKAIYDHFEKIWGLVKGLKKGDYITYRSYYQKELLPLLGHSEINRHIFTKPFGYPGDFVSMNYIYDYHDKYLGKNTFEKFINHLTTTIPISCSNIERKAILKEKILSTIHNDARNSKITSIASGPAREIIELVNKNNVFDGTTFTCLDFESRALNHIKSLLPDTVRINYVHANLIELIKKREYQEKIREQDLIYAFGIYDYLSDLLAKRLTKTLFSLLKPGGELFICNISKEKESLRSYFEFLGEWEMIYRTKEQMTTLASGLDCKNIELIDYPDNGYFFMSLKK